MRPGLLIPVLACLLAACGREQPPPASPPAASEPASGAADPGPSPDAARRWMTYQYLVDEPAAAPAMVEALVRSGWHRVDPTANALGVLGVFLARLAADNPGLIDDWVAAAETGPDESVLVFGYAAWAAEPAASEPRLRRLAAALPEPTRPALLDLIGQTPVEPAALPPEPGTLDLWWACFFATGDTRWVDLVLEVIPGPGVSFEASGLDDPARLELVKAAAWSLTSNAAQHPRVLDHLRARVEAAEAPWPTGAEMVKAAEQQAAAAPPDVPAGDAPPP